jgi:uncharacterized caspase-like protein
LTDDANDWGGRLARMTAELHTPACASGVRIIGVAFPDGYLPVEAAGGPPGAGPGETALFYYSGHGSQEPALPEHAELEPDGLNETLVLHDSRSVDGYDLADKELAQLVAEASATGAHVLVVLDCCHSGSGTRAALEDGLTIRRAPTDTRLRPAQSYLATPAVVGAATRSAASRT